MNKDSKIYVAGHLGLVGSAVVKQLQEDGFRNIVYRKHKELDLLDGEAVRKFFEKESPEYVILAAAKVGGIIANSKYGAEFIYENLQIQNNVIHQSYLSNVEKLLFLGSTCIYPKHTEQPIKEEYLLTGELEPTNEPYAIAKIAGIKMCESYNNQYDTNFISLMPTNLYGPNDNFDLESGHVLPALLRKMHEAKENDHPTVEVFGTGKPRREFMYSSDLASACVYILKNVNKEDVDNEHINIGTGSDISIKNLSILIKDIVGYKGELIFNDTYPDGTLLKRTDVTKLNNLGWKYSIDLKQGIQDLYRWYKKIYK